MRTTTAKQLRVWEAFWKIDLERPERADYYAAQTANEVARLCSVTMQVATAKEGSMIDPNKVDLNDMVLKFKTKEDAPTLTAEEARKQAAKFSKAAWAARLGYSEVPK